MEPLLILSYIVQSCFSEKQLFVTNVTYKFNAGKIIGLSHSYITPVILQAGREFVDDYHTKIISTFL